MLSQKKKNRSKNEKYYKFVFAVLLQVRLSIFIYLSTLLRKRVMWWRLPGTVEGISQTEIGKSIFSIKNVHHLDIWAEYTLWVVGIWRKKSVIRSIHVLHKMKGRNWVQILGIYSKRKRFHVVFTVKNVSRCMLYV